MRTGPSFPSPAKAQTQESHGGTSVTSMKPPVSCSASPQLSAQHGVEANKRPLARSFSVPQGTVQLLLNKPARFFARVSRTNFTYSMSFHS